MAAARACVAMENLYGIPPKTDKTRDQNDKLLEQGSRNCGSGTTTNKANDRSKNLQIEVYDQNAKVINQVIELCSDDDDDDEEPDTRRERCRIEEEHVESYPCKRAKTSKSKAAAMDKEKEVDYDIQVFDKQTDVVSFNNELQLFGNDQNQPFHESISSDDEAPIAVILQDHPENTCEFGSSSSKSTIVNVLLESKPITVRGQCSHNSHGTSQFDIVSSDNGAIKISLLYKSSRKPGSNMPNMKAITKEVENKYRTIYGITNPDFSVMKMMEEICISFSKTEAAGDDDIERITQMSKQKILTTNDSAMTPNTVDVPSHIHGCKDANEASKSSRSKTVMKNRNHLQDITRGEERVHIPLLNNGAKELPNFFYIAKNISFKDAYVTFSLARISDDNCCAQCIGDCLSSDIPCACAGETRGEFAYTPGGLLKETFLEEAITMSQRPKRQHFFYCENCPLENNPLHKHKRKRACKGHLMRKFIKECWNKCGCNKKCGNRVVQRGITTSLQVFSTPEGKGWGLRAVDALKKGTFVCEYVGEIVTNHELHLRNNQRSGDEEHTYPVLLDADWGSEGVLKDEDALCLDATKYGNCARFINHRCVDANLVEIPVEIETPDHHYYHLAFFTTRDIEPAEELNWDYGIQFDDKTHPIKAFNCKCGSIFCRDK